MELATMGSLVSNVGFPIGITLIVIYAIYKGFKALLDKVFKPILDRFLQSLDQITESNKILVQTNASFVGNINTKMEHIENKVDKIMEGMK